MQQQNSFWVKVMNFFFPTLGVVVIWRSPGSYWRSGDNLDENNAFLKGTEEGGRGFALLL